VEVNKMFNDLSEMVKDNDAEIEDICKNINDSHDMTEKGFQDIVDANRLQIEGGACVIS
jgi:t-SNARE complex subunit (syntaxin)